MKNSALKDKEAIPFWRQARLYNADFLLRKYNYKLNEIKDIMEDGMLPNDDPKLLIARKNLDEPIDINKASYKELLRIPGIGKISARKIIRNKVQGYKDLQKNRIIKRAIPFISINNVYQKTLI